MTASTPVGDRAVNAGDQVGSAPEKSWRALRPAAEDDLELLRAWRNQAANRAVSASDRPIEADEHRRWWEAGQRSGTRYVLVYAPDGTPRGSTTFDVEPAEPRTARWSFALDHDGLDAAGMLLPGWLALVDAALAYAFADPADGGLGLARLTGEVAEDNAAVRMLNRRVGVIEHPEDARDVDGRRFVPITLDADDHAARRRKR